VALTEWDNVPSGPTLGDGFPQTGNGNFTGPEFIGAPGAFILFDGSQRTDHWSLQIIGADAAKVPEPATATLTLAALATLAAWGRRAQRRQQ
jgi:hypothetical protein